MVIEEPLRQKSKNESLIESNFNDREQYIWILDYLPYGHANIINTKSSNSKKPIIQAIGEDYFTLLEIEPKINKIPSLNSRLSLNNESFIDHVKCRITYSDLSRGAKIELPIVLEQIVKIHESKFIDFINKAHPISVRMNSLELIPGIGKKLMWDIIDASKDKPFTCFEDLRKRVSSYREPEKTIVKRIILELENKEKYNVFVLYNKKNK